MNFYDILEIGVDASDSEIRSQYQRLARTIHPDKSSAVDNHEKFIQISEAYQVLSDPQKRKEYDDNQRREKLYQEWVISEELLLEELDYEEQDGIYIHTCRCGGQYILAVEEVDVPEIVVICDNCSLALLVLIENIHDKQN
ncbi:unnamed protein product [Meganyctiphanes norvegica]|uniref:Uncharacterized protein n=1 Tax=Meganyctiphanes norvegica TaxID=48144 RepID=A0AAV2RLC0_MEGNR